MAPRPSSSSSNSNKINNNKKTNPSKAAQQPTSTTTTTSSSVPYIDPSSSFTPASFERELQSLAAKARTETWGKFAREQAAVYLKSASVLALAALYATVSQLALSPVYGAIPAARWHARLLMAACFAGWSSNLLLSRVLPFRTEKLLPVVALYVPMVQFFLGKFSGTLTATWGPLVTEAVTLFPLVALSAACVATYLEAADLSALPGWVADAAPGLGSYGFFKAAQVFLGRLVERYVGKTLLTTRLGMEMALAGRYALFAPSKLLVWAVPALLHTALFNTHVPTSTALAALNRGLAPAEYVVLDRAESLTGYISVIDNIKDGYRVMRCDQSLLGGEWIKFQEMDEFKGNQVAEPVYGVFTMLEAVRLVKTPRPVPDNKAKALVM